MIWVLDSSAMIALARKETGWDVVAEALADPASTSFAHAFSLCEVPRDHIRVSGLESALEEARALADLGVVFREDMDAGFCQEIALVKDRLNLPWGDCFCIVLARTVGATVLTSDRGDFERVAASGECRVRFIR